MAVSTFQAIKLATSALTAVMLVCDNFKFMSTHQFEQLRENCNRMARSLDFLFKSMS